MEQNENDLGPRYAVRLGDLQNWHVATAVCGECRHKRVMRLWEVKRGQPDHTLLMSVRGKATLPGMWLSGRRQPDSGVCREAGLGRVAKPLSGSWSRVASGCPPLLPVWT